MQKATAVSDTEPADSAVEKPPAEPEAEAKKLVKNAERDRVKKEKNAEKERLRKEKEDQRYLKRAAFLCRSHLETSKFGKPLC